MLQFCDSADHYSTLSQKWDSHIQSGGVTTPAVSSSAVRTGTNGITLGGGTLGTSGKGYIQKSLTGSPATIIVGFALKPNTWPGTTGTDTHNAKGQLVSFFDGGGEQVGVRLLNGGQLAAYRTSTSLGTTVRSLALSAWRYIQVKVAIHNTTGTVDILVDGVSWLSLTGQNTRGTTSNNYATSVVFGVYNIVPVNDGAQVPLAVHVDDIYIIDTTGSYNTTYLGDVAIQAKLPTANGGVVNLSRGGTDSGANWSQVDENPPNSDTDYVFSGTVGNKDRYTYPSIVGVTIPAVVVNPFARKDDGATRSIRGIANLSGTEVDNGTDLTLSSTYVYQQAIFERDPNVAAWTQTNVNNTEFGVKITA